MTGDAVEEGEAEEEEGRPVAAAAVLLLLLLLLALGCSAVSAVSMLTTQVAGDPSSALTGANSATAN